MFWRTQTKLKGPTPANGIGPIFLIAQKTLADSNNLQKRGVRGRVSRRSLSDVIFILSSALMDGTQQVVDSFDGVESRCRHFDKDCRPVAHGAVPETGKLEGSELAAGE